MYMLTEFSAGAKHFRIVKFELIKLYEIQHDLRQLSYFDVFGRLRLSLQLARVTLSIPMVIDKAMKEEEGSEGEVAGFVEDGYHGRGQMVKRGLLGPRIACVLGTVSCMLLCPPGSVLTALWQAVSLLEKGERII